MRAVQPTHATKPKHVVRLVLMVWFCLLIGLIGWQYQRRRVLLDALPSQPIGNSMEQRTQQMRTDLQDGRRWLTRVEPMMLSMDVPSLLASLTQWSEESNVQLVSTSQSAMKTESIYHITPFQVDIQGEYGALTRFLYRFEQEAPHVPLGGMRLWTRASDAPILQLTFYLLSSSENPTESGDHTEIAGVDVSSFHWESRYTYPSQASSRNPFRRQDTLPIPPSPSTAQTPTPILTAILWDETNPMAILELQNQSQMLRVHDTLGEYEIVTIQPSSVTLRRGQEMQHFQLWSRQNGSEPIQIQ